MWSPPDRLEELFPRAFQCGEAEDFPGDSADGLAERFLAAVGIGDDERPKPVLSEDPAERTGKSEFEILLRFLLPNGKAFGAEVHFEEQARESRRSEKFGVPVGFELEFRRDCVVKCDPPAE